MEAHQAAVEAIAARTRQFYKTRTPFRIYHGSTNSTRRSQRRADNTVDTSKLNRVLQVVTDSEVAIVEPNVPMDALVVATLEKNLVPLDVMEFPGITVGGGFSGTSGESSSFRYGAFDATVNWIEIVLPNGEVVTASKTEKPDLFWGAASAFGTLGTVTLLQVQLKPARRYVHLTYQLATSVGTATDILQAETRKKSNDYVDAITFSLSETIVCTGYLTDDIPKEMPPRRFLRARDPWFYVHAQRVLKRLRRHGGSEKDFIPLPDYLFRYNRGAFWAARYAYKYFITPFNRITRFILDPFMQTRIMYRALHHSGLGDFYMIQDVGVPFDKAEEFTLWLDRALQLYPLWLCPLRVRRDSPNSQYGLHAEFADPGTQEGLLNFGIWGPISFDRREVVRQNRALEDKVLELGGKKWLYAHAYYSEEEFWAHYDRKSYDALRAKYSSSYMPSVYDKVKVDVDAEEAASRASWGAWLFALLWTIWPLRGLYGVFWAIFGSNHLLQGGSSQGVDKFKAG